MKGCNASCIEAAPKKSGEDDSMGFGMWRKCVEKLGSGLRAADKRRLCAVETYPSASATTTLEPQASGDSAAISPHPRRGDWTGGALEFGRTAGCEAVGCGLCATCSAGAVGPLGVFGGDRSFPGWRGERLMRGSGRASSSPKVVPEGAIQYVRLRGCGRSQRGVEERELGAVAISTTGRASLYTSSASASRAQPDRPLRLTIQL